MNFSQGLSGLNAASQKMNAIGNNIANSHTIGYKKSDLSFADIMACSKIGAGVEVSGVHQNFNNGVLEEGSNALDLAIDGNGFFCLESASGQEFYSRNGQFQPNQQGFITNAEGMYLMGYQPVGNPPSLTPGSIISRLQVPIEPMPARITDGGSLTAKLNSLQPSIPTEQVFAPQNGQSYSAMSRHSAYDSLGHKHDIDLYFVKKDDNRWKVYSHDVTAPLTQQEANMANNIFQTIDIQFDSTGHLLAGNTDINVKGDKFRGADALNFNIDLSKLTQGAISSDTPILIEGQQTSGYTSGTVSSYAVDENGVIEACYSNNEKQPIGQVVLSKFINNDGLSPQGHHCWAETKKSGNALKGGAGSSNLGKIYGQRLESSNVDLSQEIIHLMQTSFFSNANMKTISTMSETLQKLCNIG